MKRVLKNILALFLCVLLLSGAAPSGLLTLLASAKTIQEYARGDLVTFGWYPQSKVADSVTVNTLNNQSVTWRSYGCYSKNALTSRRHNQRMTRQGGFVCLV